MMDIIIYILIFLIVALIAYRFFTKPKLSVTNSFIEDKVFLEIKVIKPNSEQRTDIQSDPLAAEQLFSVVHGILKEGIVNNLFSFEIFVSDEKIKFIVVTPSLLASHIESQIYAQYPLAQISRITDYTSDFENYSDIKSGSLVLGKDQNIPILTFRDFEIDPLSAITSSLSQVKAGEGLAIQLIAKPTPDTWQIKGYDLINKIKKKDNTKAVTLIQMFFGGMIEL